MPDYPAAQRDAIFMEVDPLYADVIVTRWEKFTGKEAVLHETEMTFADVARERGVAAGEES